jgi:nucleotide-binding universal stress UspA family protein
MSYAAIMVHVGIDDASDARVTLAGDLADRFNAGLIGISGWGKRPPFVVEGVIVESGPSADEVARMQAELAKMGEAFRSAAGKGRRPVEWRADLEFPSDLILREARAADLIVISGAARTANIFRSVDPGTIMLKAGRPVLVVPQGRSSLEAKRVMIAWKNTREARRALRDALPFLQQAERVFIVAGCGEGEEDDAQSELGDIARYLERHRIAASTSIVLHVKGAVAGELVRVAQEEKIDLIVAGAYGHTRLGEWVFGGVTRGLLAASPVCCLFSH